MKTILVLMFVSVLCSGCFGHLSRFVERNGRPVSADEFKKDVYQCYYMTHWRSLSNLSWPIYGYFYNFYYQFSSLKDEEDAAAGECLKDRGYQGKATNVR